MNTKRHLSQYLRKVDRLEIPTPRDSLSNKLLPYKRRKGKHLYTKTQTISNMFFYKTGHFTETCLGDTVGVHKIGMCRLKLSYIIIYYYISLGRSKMMIDR